MERKHILNMPEENFLCKEHGEPSFFVASTKGWHLRPDLQVLFSTGYSEEVNVGYWKTFEEALETKLAYEKLHENKHDDVYDAMRYVSEREYITSICKLDDKEQKSTRGNGGSTSYYSLPENATELSDLIYHKEMNHSIGEAFCAIYRLNDNGEYVRNIKKAIFYLELELKQCDMS